MRMAPLHYPPGEAAPVLNKNLQNPLQSSEWGLWGQADELVNNEDHLVFSRSLYSIRSSRGVIREMIFFAYFALFQNCNAQK